MIPYINQDYYDTLVELLNSLSGIKTGLEIGTGWGTSCQAFFTAYPEAHLYSVEQENYHGVFKPLQEIFKDKLTIIQGRSPEIYYYLHSRLDPVDYIFIDAAHDYESCKADILGCMPVLKPGGVMVFDDYYMTGTTEEGKEFGVKKAVEEFIPNKWIKIFDKRNIVAFRKGGENT